MLTIKTKKGMHVIDVDNNNVTDNRFDCLYGKIESTDISMFTNNKSIYVHDDIDCLSISNTYLCSYNKANIKKVEALDNTDLNGLSIEYLDLKHGNHNVKNCVIENLYINNASKRIYLYNNIIKNIVINEFDANKLSFELTYNTFYCDVVFNKISKNNYPITITLNKNTFINCSFILEGKDLEEKDYICSLFYNNFVNGSIISNNDFLYLVENKCNGEYIYAEKYLKNTGYIEGFSTPIYKEQTRINRYKLLKVDNIPQYVSFENDPALQTGCEATACAICASYTFNKKITKNEMASYMTKASPGSISFWKSFIGDIYNDGWGCMSSVSKDTLNKYLESNNLNNEYEIICLTNTSLYSLLYYLDKGCPVICFATMGNNETMYSRRIGSTVWNINNEILRWPGNDHSLVIIGYNLNKEEIYLADPEVNNTSYRVRDIYLFENRFAQLYSQSIIIKKKKQ